MLCAYPACFIKEDNGYSVLFPDLDTATCGETLEEAMRMAIDCLAGVLYLMKKDGETPPAPSQPGEVDPAKVVEDMCGDGEGLPPVPLTGAFVNLVTVDVEEYAKCHFEKSVKKTLSIPAWLNEAALRANLNFSQVLQEALKERLEMI